MRPIFDNGATRERAVAWMLWLLFASAWAAAAVGQEWRHDRRPAAAMSAALLLGTGLLLVRRRPRRILVLNYHSVSQQPEWMGTGPLVSIDPSLFERQLKYLRRRGYKTIFISEAAEELAGGGRSCGGGKCAAITLDDGYADNWIAVFPLLRKHKVKATIFIPTAFVADTLSCRPTTDDVPDASRIDWSGYLAWPELAAMVTSGLVEIQSHGCLHTRVFAGQRPIGFVGPGRMNQWLLWNSFPESRSDWWKNSSRLRRLWGHPLFRQAPALAARKAGLDPAAAEHMLNWAQGQGQAFFQGRDWECACEAEWRRFIRGRHEAVKPEPESEFARRVEADLAGSRQTLQDRLGVQADILCWPENAFTEEGLDIARKVGYRATVSNRHRSRNVAGEEGDRIMRVFVGSHVVGFRNRLLDFAGFVLEVRVFEGNYVWYPVLAVAHMMKRIAFGIGGKMACGPAL